MDNRPNANKNRLILSLTIALLAAVAIASIALNPTAPTSTPPATAVQSPVQTQQLEKGNLSNDNYYTNSDGNKVHSPAYSDIAPADATARCRDGTYSFSQHRRGTCSHHGGVERWLY
jgi:Protein of unknown function (DUF3761)